MTLDTYPTTASGKEPHAHGRRQGRLLATGNHFGKKTATSAARKSARNGNDSGKHFGKHAGNDSGKHFGKKTATIPANTSANTLATIPANIPATPPWWYDTPKAQPDLDSYEPAQRPRYNGGPYQ